MGLGAKNLGQKIWGKKFGAKNLGRKIFRPYINFPFNP